MKKIYLHLMALICLLLCGGVNAWASESWVAYQGNTQVSVTITTQYADKFVSNLQAKANSQITYSHSGTSGLVGVSVPGTNKLYLKPTTAGFLNLRIACANGYPLTVTIHDNTDNKDVASVNVVTPTATNTYYGETVLFEVVAGHEYVLNASDGITYYVTVVTKIESSDMAEVSENMSASEMGSAIGSDKTIVKMHRTLKAGIWNTFSTPIQLGPNAMSAELKCNEAYELGAFDETTNTITFTKSDHIYAGVPYLIKPTEDVTEITVSNRSHPATYAPQSVTNGKLSFVAALATTNIYTDDHSKFFLNTEGYLLYPSSSENGTIKGLRAYFEWADASVKDMTFVFDDSETTGIKTIEHDIFGENGRVYSIDGRYMGDSTDNLSRGIYIQNGRKFVVK